MDQWKSLFGAYRLARSQRDGCVVAGNGPLLPPPEQTEMMNSDVFTCQHRPDFIWFSGHQQSLKAASRSR